MSQAGINNRRIGKAFGKVLDSIKDKSYRAISDGTKRGYDYALDIHKKSKHELHLNLGGDFGYMVSQDGVEKKSDVVKGKVEVYATAAKSLEEHLGNAPESGVLGVVSAGMESAPFNDGWEVAVLKSAFSVAKEQAIKVIEK